MPRTARSPHPRRRTLVGPTLLAGALVALLAGPSASPAGAAARHAPCPTVGRTLAKDVSPNLRVWREGTTMKACSRWPGERRHVRTLGPWSPATRVATGSGAVAWTTRAQTDAGVLADAVTTIDVPSGRRWLRTSRAAVARAGAPASEDRVLRLITSDLATAWVTRGGVVALAVEQLDETATTGYPAGAPADLHRDGSRYFLGDAGPAAAAAVAKGLRFHVGGESDGCGGSDVHELRVPAFGDHPAASFVFAETPVPAGDECG